MYWAMRIKTIRWVGTVLWMGITGTLILPVGAQSLTDFEKRVHEFTLDNGLKFLVLERHEAPVVSFHTYADVGSVDEVKGIKGSPGRFSPPGRPRPARPTLRTRRTPTPESHRTPTGPSSRISAKSLIFRRPLRRHQKTSV